MFRRIIHLATFSLLALSGCTDSNPESAYESRARMSAEICSPISSKVVVQSYQTINGSTINGSVFNSSVYRAQPWASALYVTRAPTMSSTREGSTLAPFCGQTGYCVPVIVPRLERVEESLGNVYGLARIPLRNETDTAGAIADAEYQAEENCQQAADQFARSRGTTRYSRPYSLQCIKLVSTVCSF